LHAEQRHGSNTYTRSCHHLVRPSFGSNQRSQKRIAGVCSHIERQTPGVIQVEERMKAVSDFTAAVQPVITETPLLLWRNSLGAMVGMTWTAVLPTPTICLVFDDPRART
jgi:hypothetical protein